MEEQKIDKRTKDYKEALKRSANNLESNELDPSTMKGLSSWADSMTSIISNPIDRLIEIGVPVTKAEFHAAVNNVDNVPETHFSEKSDSRNRRAEMWLTASGNLLICKQDTAKGVTKYIGVPSASVKFVHFK